MPRKTTRKSSDQLFAAPGRASVLLPVALDESYDYKVDPARPVAPGDVVRVPLGPKDRTGIVWDDPINESLDAARLKPVIERFDVPPLPAGLRKFIDWVARYTVSPRGQVLRMSLATPDLFREPPRQKAYELTGVEPERMTGARERVMATLRNGPPRAQGDLAEAAGVSPSVIKGLEDQGVVRALFLPSPERRSYEPPRPDLQGPSLSKGQAAAAAVLRESVANGGYETTVLEGVTGSGKTEVYFEAVAEALRAAEDSQVLVLVPEIALTGQLLSRFETRFGAAPVAWHSDMTPAERRRAWHGVRSGAARVVVGARSALFLPFPGLRLIVVDEEHDSSYKQEDGVLYHARDMAVVRATMENCAAILSSATPSLETLVNVWEGKYAHVHLPERHGGATLPEISTIDMRAADIEPRRWLSGPMVRAMGATLEAGEQVLLFLNRRGYAPAAICRACGHRLEHEACSTPLVVHQYGNRLRCHHCAYAIPMPHACPECGEEETIRAWGPGVERLEEEVNSRFPDKTVGLMTSDTISSAARAEDFIARIIENEFDVVIGTQLVTKGHHFPMLTLVGIVDGDMGLSSGDLRAAERTYQQLWQVSGRAGRAARPGQVLIQTHMPDHPVMQALVKGDGERFLQLEADSRRRAGWPPFGRLAALILSGRDHDAVEAHARELARSAPRAPETALFGPVPAPISRLRGRFRYRLLLKAPRGFPIQRYVREWLDPHPPKGGVRVAVDIDPYSFF